MNSNILIENTTEISSTPDINFTSYCQEASEMVSSPNFIVALSIEIIQSILASILNSCLMYTIWKVTVFHTNLRLLLFHLSLNLTVMSFAMIGRAIYILSIFYIIQNPCRLVITVYRCKLEETVMVVPLVNGIYSLISIGIERAYATIRYRSYDKSKSTPWLACILIPIVWFIVSMNHLMPLRDMPRDKLMPVCSNLLSMPSTVAGKVLVQNMSVEMIAVLLAIGLYLINNRLLHKSAINRAKHTLAARFQVSQNVNVNKILLPTISCHATFSLFIYVYLLLFLNGLDWDDATKLLLIHVNYIVLLMFAIVHPILAFLKNPHLKRICCNAMSNYLPKWVKRENRDKRRSQQNAAVAATVHFETLERMWNTVDNGKLGKK